MNKLHHKVERVSIHSVRVYYEDTDASGRVYHANYLKYAERGRTEMLRSLQFEQSRLKNDSGLFFAVYRCHVTYLLPAFLDDDLAVHSRLFDIKKARMIFDQQIWRQEKCITKLSVEVVCVNNKGKATRIPESVLSRLIAKYTG